MMFNVLVVLGLLVPLAFANLSGVAPILKRSASLTAPTPSSSASSNSTAQSPSVATVVTTSVETSGTNTFTTTFTTTFTNTSGGVATGTLTTTSFPSLSTYDPCVSNCLALAVSQVNCSTVTDVACYCSNGNFPLDLLGCISSQCTGQVSSAESLGRQFCSLATVTLTFPPTPSTSTSPSGSPSNSTTSPAQSGTSSASHHQFRLPSLYEILLSIAALVISY